MLDYADYLADIKSTFDKKIHFLTVQYVHFIPEEHFFNLAGTFNERVGDWSNWPKIPDDLIFMGLLKIDDSHVQRGWVEKLPVKGKKCHMKVTIEIHPLSELRDRSAQILPLSLKSELE
jgi:hypothetical protein